jgi:AAA+ ATPase superfamily predicted ATPase
MIGRQEEIALLQTLEQADKSSFVAVYGRRRVGKTYLIRTVFEKRMVFQLTGLARMKIDKQLANFHAALVKNFPQYEEKPIAQDWFQAFLQLEIALETSNAAKKIVFLDELPWLDSRNSGFISALEHFWNSWASARRDVLLITCGSAASWMINNLINNHGGLHNRVTHQMPIDPFTLAECEAFFKSRSATFDRYQLLQLYMVLGGIPFYLDMVETAQSAAQNINRLCFTPKGALRKEFDNLYASLFRNADKHIAVIEALAKKAQGMGREDLIKAANLVNNGNTSKILKELEESDFIRRYHTFGKNSRNSLYQLTDFYSLFYLKFLKSNRILDTDFWLNSLDNPEVRAWSGYAFEQICLSHLSAIKKALGISGIQTISSAWLGSYDNQKAQIDLVIDRRDHVITICEMKFSINPFIIEKKYADDLRTRIGIFKQSTGTSKAIFLTFITTFGLVKNEHAMSLVQNSFTMDILFQ